jgi:signal transduction histidine kinase
MPKPNTIWLVLLLSLPVITYSQSINYIDVQGIDHYRIANDPLEEFIDRSEALTPEQVMEHPFTSIEKDKLNKSRIIEAPHFLRFNLANSGDRPGEALLFMGRGIQYDLFRLDPVKGNMIKQPASQFLHSDVLMNDVPYSAINIPAHGQTTFLVKPDLHFFNKRFLDVAFVNPDHRTSFEFSHLFSPVRPFSLLAILVLGIMTAMGLFSMFRFLSNRRGEYLYYGIATCLFSINFILELLAYFNFSSGFFYTETFRMHCLEFGGFAFILMFISRLMDLRKINPDLNRMIKVLIGIMGSFTFIDLFLAFSDQRHYLSVDIYYGLEIFLLCTCTYVVISCFRTSSRLSWFLLAGSIAFFIPAAIGLYLTQGNGHSITGSHFAGEASAIFMCGILFLLFHLLLASGYKSNHIEIGRMKAIEYLRLENDKKDLEQYRAVMEARDKERNRVAQQIHDEIGTGLTSIRLNSEIAERRQGKDWKPDFERISAITDKLMDRMNDILWSMNNRNDSLASLVAYLRHQIVEYFESHHIDLRLVIPDHLPDLEISSPIRRNILVSVKEALHNIVNITHGTRVEIEFIADQQFTIIIRDNGLALSESQKSAESSEIQDLDARLRSIGGAYSVSEGKNSTQQLQVPIR